MLTSAKLNTTTQICSRLRRRALKIYCAYSGAKFPSADYHADHQPPQKIAEDLNITAGVLLPQCKWCSNKQSSCVKKARKNPGWETSSSDHVVTNGLLQFRFFKLFLPWPLLFDAILLNYFWIRLFLYFTTQGRRVFLTFLLSSEYFSLSEFS